MSEATGAPVMPAESPDLSIVASGLIREFHEAGVLDWADVHVARRIMQLSAETNPSVELAAALTVWAVRAGSVCIDLETIAAETFERGEERADTALLSWPDPSDWVKLLAGSPSVGCEPDGPQRPLRLVGSRVYLDRYWRDEERVRDSLQRRVAQVAPPVDGALLDAQLDALFTDDPEDLQRQACRVAATSWVSVVAGGPGTGKTTIIGRILVALDALGLRRVALAAPTGKAAVRLGEAVSAELHARGLSGSTARAEPVTLHRLLGLRPGSGPTDGAPGRLPYDVIVVDEMSMVSLPLMARLLTATALDTRLVLVGDPDQLASVEAGAVLADLTDGVASKLGVVKLTKNYRFGSAIARLADAVRGGDADEVLRLLAENSDAVSFAETDLLTTPVPLRARIAEVGAELWNAADSGDIDAALRVLDTHRVLCGHRRGPFGVSTWNRHAHRWISDITPEFGADGEWYVGRPVLVTHNTSELGLFNGDTGVVVAGAGARRVAFPGGRTVPVSALDDVSTAHAMTVHKSQGSQFDEVSLILPPPGSPLLTRQLLYTAVTRARRHLTVYGQADAVAEAVARPALRASGLRARL